MALWWSVEGQEHDHLGFVWFFTLLRRCCAKDWGFKGSLLCPFPLAGCLMLFLRGQSKSGPGQRQTSSNACALACFMSHRKIKRDIRVIAHALFLGGPAQ
jgi:hypothetical protein